MGGDLGILTDHLLVGIHEATLQELHDLKLNHERYWDHLADRVNGVIEVGLREDR